MDVECTILSQVWSYIHGGCNGEHIEYSLWTGQAFAEQSIDLRSYLRISQEFIAGLFEGMGSASIAGAFGCACSVFELYVPCYKCLLFVS